MPAARGELPSRDGAVACEVSASQEVGENGVAGEQGGEETSRKPGKGAGGRGRNGRGETAATCGPARGPAGAG